MAGLEPHVGLFWEQGRAAMLGHKVGFRQIKKNLFYSIYNYSKNIRREVSPNAMHFKGKDRIV